MNKKNTEVKSINSSWNFELDQVNLYAFWKECFTKEECNKIVNIARSNNLIKGKINNNNNKNEESNIRDSRICWLYPNHDMEWVFRRVTDVVLNLNERFFKFDIFGLNEGFQFTNYIAPSGKYGKHVDRAMNMAVRKLSVSIQLTDPKKYKGGDLCLYQGDKADIMDKEQGTLIVFPSYILHEVTPVTKGERNSLVSWVTGKQFK